MLYIYIFLCYSMWRRVSPEATQKYNPVMLMGCGSWLNLVPGPSWLVVGLIWLACSSVACSEPVQTCCALCLYIQAWSAIPAPPTQLTQGTLANVDFHLLTHWGRVTHICVGKLTNLGSDNGLSPGRRQAIIWTNAGISLIGPLGTNFSEILIGIQTFSFTKMHLKMSSAKWRPFCLSLNELNSFYVDLPSNLKYQARLIIETNFENSPGRSPKLGVHLILEIFFGHNVKTRLDVRNLTVSNNRWSCGWVIFPGNWAIKTSKTSSLLDDNIVLKILDH